MKKLIAIVITLILIFNGTGYCLRPPLAFWKTNEIITASINWDVVKNHDKATMNFVMSYSGVRGVFGDGPEISEECKIIALVSAYTYVNRLIKRWHKADPGKRLFRLLIGMDTRHTGPALKEFQALGFRMAAQDTGVDLELIDLGVTTTPFIESSVITLDADGGVMITASHNKKEDNGFKYLTGLREPGADLLNSRGGILNGKKMSPIIRISKYLLNRISKGKSDLIDRANKMIGGTNHSASFRDEEYFRKAHSGYKDLIRNVFRLSEEKVRKIQLSNQADGRKMVFDANGGAGYEIIPSVLGDFIEVVTINGEPGKFAHKIEPVGEALDDAMAMLNRYLADFGLIPDCDSDRGNLVMVGRDGKAIVVHPQDVVLLNVASVLAWIKVNLDRYPEAKDKKWAVVVHDATSSRVAEIAEKFGVEVIEVETGEANIVTVMHELEQGKYPGKEGEKYFVPMGMEGANGGTIFMGTEVRDGTLTALMCVLALSDKAVFNELAKRMGKNEEERLHAGQKFSLLDILNILPKYYTRQEDFKEKGITLSQQEIKEGLESAFIDRIKPTSENGLFNIFGLGDKEFKAYQIVNYEETRVLVGMGNRKSQTGGFKIALIDTENKKYFIWFRGSKTESGLFRAVVDSPDSIVTEKLAELQRELYQHALYSESSIYYRLVKEKGLKGRAIDIGSASNHEPAEALVRAGIDAVEMIDIEFHDRTPYNDRITRIPGNATELVDVLGENSVEITVFNNSLPFIVAHAGETSIGEELERKGEGQLQNLFFFVDVLDRVFAQVHAVLKPNGTLLIATDDDFIEGRRPAVLRGTNLIESLTRHGFIDIEQRVIGKYGDRVIISAKKKGISPLDMAVKTRNDL